MPYCPVFLNIHLSINPSKGNNLTQQLLNNLTVLLLGDSTLRTLHSDTKITILNLNLNVKMFDKGVQTNIENTFSVPFPPNKKML